MYLSTSWFSHISARFRESLVVIDAGLTALVLIEHKKPESKTKVMNPSQSSLGEQPNSSNQISATTDSGDTKKGSSKMLIDYTKPRADGRKYCQNEDNEVSASPWRRLSPDLPTEISISVRRPKTVQEKGVVVPTNSDDGNCHEIVATVNGKALWLRSYKRTHIQLNPSGGTPMLRSRSSVTVSHSLILYAGNLCRDNPLGGDAREFTEWVQWIAYDGPEC